MARAKQPIPAVPKKFPWRRAQRTERRRNKDLLLKVLTALGYLNAAIIILAAMLLSEAKPDAFAGLYKGLPLKHYWRPHIMHYLFILAILGVAVATTGLIINTKRLKRKNDSIRANLIFLETISILGVITYLIVF